MYRLIYYNVCTYLQIMSSIVSYGYTAIMITYANITLGVGNVLYCELLFDKIYK